MNTKWLKTIYWATTSVFALLMTFSAVMYLTDANTQAAFVHLGLPSYFRLELAFFKITGALALLVPLSKTLREWAYAGFFLTLTSAVIAHFASGDPLGVVIAPVIVGGLLVSSYVTSKKLNQA